MLIAICFGDDNDELVLGTSDIDLYYGARGNDTLHGGAGRDRLTGGPGGDILTGGTEANVFVFRYLDEIRPSATLRDQVTDFQVGLDKLDLLQINQGNAAFVGGVSFSGTGGAEVRYTPWNGALSVDRDGNGSLDGGVLLIGNPALTAADLIF